MCLQTQIFEEKLRAHCRKKLRHGILLLHENTYREKKNNLEVLVKPISIYRKIDRFRNSHWILLSVDK